MNTDTLYYRKDIRTTGFSLMEVALATVIFAIVIMTLLGIFTQGYLYSRQMRMASVAYFLAQEKLEEYYNASAVFPIPANVSMTSFGGDFAQYNFTVNFTCPLVFGAETHDNLALINVTVYWLGRQGQRSFSLNTFLANITQ